MEVEKQLRHGFDFPTVAGRVRCIAMSGEFSRVTFDISKLLLPPSDRLLQHVPAILSGENSVSQGAEEVVIESMHLVPCQNIHWPAKKADLILLENSIPLFFDEVPEDGIARSIGFPRRVRGGDGRL